MWTAERQRVDPLVVVEEKGLGSSPVP